MLLGLAAVQGASSVYEAVSLHEPLTVVPLGGQAQVPGGAALGTGVVVRRRLAARVGP